MKTYHILRHKETGVVMPLFPSNRGYTHWMGEAMPSAPPRIFATELAAKRARGMWAKGVATPRFIYYNEGAEHDGIDFEDAGRSKDDLEIVPIVLLTEEAYEELVERGQE